MITFYPVSAKLPALYQSLPSLHVCNSRNQPVKVMQWQCKENLTADLTQGVYCSNPQFVKKALGFVRKAGECHADLVLTPEYSFPYEALETILQDNSLWPADGSLWCLGSQGASKDNFQAKMAKWSHINKIQVIDFAFSTLSNRAFVNPLIYLFKLDQNTLCILPQFKTTPSHDIMNQYEASSLALGDCIYIFDLVGAEQCKNKFLSIICSDVLGVSSEKILEHTGDSNVTIFHPQLNTEPRHHRFRDFRNRLFEHDNGNDIRLITLNWSAGTIVDTESFEKPWSAFYIKTKDNIHSSYGLRIDNHALGTYFALKSHTEIWFSDREEHCKMFEINKAYLRGAAYVSTIHREPIVKLYAYFDSSHSIWVSSTPQAPYSLATILRNHGTNYNFPLKASVRDCDIFFGLCFGHLEIGELETDDTELLSRMSVGSDFESDSMRRSKVVQYNQLVKQIKRQKFPMELEFLKDNHNMKIDTDPYFSDKVMPNVFPIQYEGEYNPFLSALVIISEKTEISEVASLVDQITKKLPRNFKNKVLVYYRNSRGSGYNQFDEHLKETKISKGKYSKNLASIKN